MNLRTKLLSTSLFLFLFLSSAVAQNSISVSDKKQLLKLAEAYYDSTQYETALPYYLKLHETDQNNQIYNIAIGICYLNSSKNKTNAVSYLEKVVAGKKGPLNDEASFYLGKAYHLSGRFDDAIAVYEKYKSTIDAKDDRYATVTRQIEMCKTGAELIKKPVNVSLTNLAAFINSPYPEYSALVTGDDSTMIFTSRRPGSTGELKTEDGGFYEDIFVSYKVNDTIWSSPVAIDPNVNTALHDACVGLSTDGQELYVYKDDDGSGDIYMCELNGKSWSQPKKLNDNINGPDFEPSASISPDGTTLYFVSDRKEGFGGKDIYKSQRMSNGDWGPAQNMGKTINTPYDEDGPFLHADGTTFYFSSTGHSSMGGYDIFETKLDESTQTWSSPKNIGYPINTVDDDIYYSLSANGKHAYYSSIKENGVGEKDIYLINYNEPEKKSVALIKGRLADEKNNNVKAYIKLTNKNTGKVAGYASSNSATGKYTLLVKPGLDYEMAVTTDTSRNIASKNVESLVYKGNLKLPEEGKYYEVYQDVRLAQNALLSMNTTFADSIKKKSIVVNEDEEFQRLINQSKNIKDPSSKGLVVKKDSVVKDVSVAKTKEKEADRILFKTIFFGSNTTDLNAEGKKEADAIFKILKENTVMKATISGHADNRGGNQLNMVLSEKRALALYNYLKSKGVKTTRMKYKGYGETEPFTSNDTEEGRQANRRVEVKLSKE